MQAVQRPLRLYVCGPMRGKPQHNYPAFREAAKALRDRGYMVFDPSENCGGDDTRPLEEYMRHDIGMLLQVDGVATLLGWTQSQGAKLEVEIADALRVPVRTVEEWVRLEEIVR